MRKTIAALSMALYAFAGTAVAQSYPTKAVKIVVGFAAGGSAADGRNQTLNE